MEHNCVPTSLHLPLYTRSIYSIACALDIAEKKHESLIMAHTDCRLAISRPKVVGGLTLPAVFARLPLRKKGPKAFVLSIFEIQEGHEVPRDKPTLVKLLKQGIVIPFHKNFCSSCHKVPKVRNMYY